MENINQLSLNIINEVNLASGIRKSASLSLRMSGKRCGHTGPAEVACRASSIFPTHSGLT